MNCPHGIPYTSENRTTCSKFANKPSQVVFVLVTSCQQVWNKLIIDVISLVARLFQQGCYNHDVTTLLQSCFVNFVACVIVTMLFYYNCITLTRTTYITSIRMSSSLLQVVSNLFQICYNKLGTSSANTAR